MVISNYGVSNTIHIIANLGNLHSPIILLPVTQGGSGNCYVWNSLKTDNTARAKLQRCYDQGNNYYFHQIWTTMKAGPDTIRKSAVS